ncbi:DnaB-like helicase C-terminal domain-containing protein [Breoghania sp. JC706]|uniref:replicative DNA helicase n=1 Tax=Breoghania sp. JC706 TaxID=3117732 RepID=UPI00300A1416
MNAPVILQEPFNVEAEHQILGALLLDNEGLNLVSGFLEPEHFYVPCHAEIYRIIRDLCAEGRVASPVSVKQGLTIEPPNGEEKARYLVRLVGNAASNVVVADYGRAIVELATRRELMQAADTLKYHAANLPVGSIAKIIDDADAAAAHARASISFEDASPDDVGTIGAQYIEDLTQALKGEGAETPSTGFADLDRKIGCWQPGCLYVLAGRPGMGKSAFAVSSMLHTVALKPKRDGSPFGAAYFSLEVPAADLWARMASHEIFRRHKARIEYQQIKRKAGLSDGEANAVCEAHYELKDLPIRIYDRPGVTIAQVEAKARALRTTWERRGQSLDVIFLDHLGLLRPSARYRGNRTAELTEITAHCLAMAKRLGVALVLLSQLNREVEKREGCRPQLSDLRESGSIEQDANSVVFLYRPEYYAIRDATPLAFGDENRLEAIVAKSRDGATGSLDLYCDIAINFIDNGGAR